MSKIRTATGSFAYARYQLRRSILESALEDNYTTADHEAALEYFGGCAFCAAPQAPRKDHLVPVIQCGDFVRRNVVPACQKCDDSKGQKEYHEWMLGSNSPSSLRARGFTEEHIRDRVRMIEEWQAGYTPRTEAELFGDDYPRYQEMLQSMAQLCREAKALTSKAKSRRTGRPVDEVTSSEEPAPVESSADRIRGFVISRYIVPARNRGEKTITVRAGDVHAQMSLSGQHANVCQVLRGDKLQNLAGVKLRNSSGPWAGGNSYFTYDI